MKPDAEGKYYPKNKSELLKFFKQEIELIVVPHSALEYSGELCKKTYMHLNRNSKNVTVIAPAIYNRIYGCVTCDENEFETPIGNIKIKPANLPVKNEIFASETALTVQLPYIKYYLQNASITPIIYGCEDYKIIADLIKQPSVIVTNLSRFIPEREEIKLDEQTCRMILNSQTENIDIELADGAVGLCGAIEFAKRNNCKFERIGLTNSSKTNGDTSSVVGYGGFLLYKLAVK